MPNSTTFEPQWVSPPGETIADLLRLRAWSLQDFATAVGASAEDAGALVEGRMSISVGWAKRLEAAFGASLEFWITREQQYRTAMMRLQAHEDGWLDEIPVRDMIRFGWITPAPRAADEGAAVLKFFDVPSVQAWRHRYGAAMARMPLRTSSSFRSRPGALAAWLREGERRTLEAACAPWDPTRFRAAVREARALTRIGDPRRFVPRLQALFAAAGVALVVLRVPTGCRASGAAQFVSPDRAMLLVSARHLTDDHLWFTVFHEAGHLLLHHPTAPAVDEDEPDVGPSENGLFSDPRENEANNFASDVLVPPQRRTALSIALNGGPTAERVLRAASDLGIAPGILVGQLQHRGELRHDQLNGLKRRFAWSDDGLLQPKKRT